MTEQQKKLKAIQWTGLIALFGMALLLGVYFSISLMF